MRFARPHRGLIPGLIASVLLAAGVAPALAGEPDADAAPSAASDTPLHPPAGFQIEVGTGQSWIYQGQRAINRVLVSDDAVVNVKLLEEGQFQIRGMQLGNTDIWVWFRDAPNDPVRYGVQVGRDLGALRSSLAAVVGPDGQPPQVQYAGDRLVLDGMVPDLATLDRVSVVAEAYDPQFINLLRVGGDHQVQLEVVFAEVSRTRLRELGVDLWWDSGSIINGAGVTIGSVPPAGMAQTFNIVGTIAAGFDLMASLQVLEQHNLTKVLARPTLVALSGEEAEFLAGGEVPIPVAQLGDRISIEFREFGVKVNFLPTVLAGDVVDVEVYVEVSDLDAANTLRVSDITIPGLVSRKSKSHLRLGSGMTFAMAGMLDERVTSVRSKVPLLGDIPLLGALFRRVDHRREETELVIFVTPRLVRPLAPGEVPPVPGHDTNNDPGDFELFMLGLDHQPPPPGRKSKPVGPVGMER